MTIHPKSPKQTELAIRFLIIGGGMSGLACAIALRRVGHQVTVLEQERTLMTNSSAGGIRMPPNLSKILFHWGLKDELRKIAIKSMAIDLCLCDTGELLGKHIWDEEVFRETRGEFIFAHHADMRNLLYENAIATGAKVRLGCPVVSIDPDNRIVTLASGDTMTADVIIGADGMGGISQSVMDIEPPVPAPLNMYSTTVSKAAIVNDPELTTIWKKDLVTMFSWFGNGHAVLGFPTGGSDPDFALYVYGPVDGREGDWRTQAPIQGLRSILDQCEPRLRRLGQLAQTAHCIPVAEYTTVEDWVHESGRMVLLGQAAHPIPPGSIQDCALAIEDGAVLAKLFSHLRSEDQIGSFLWAFEELRQQRCSSVIMNECGIVQYMTLPPGEFQQGRDQTMRAKRDAGLNALQASDDSEETPEWAEIKEVFGYDAEDEADNWWVQWGRLRERAKGVEAAEIVNISLFTNTS
ncbi:hypothetical protein EYR40_007648 [Pleurotus pulmonarius]|nr:hypothetical protein EYR40_007648 [Pleurotus pulmonarius]